MSAMDRKGEGTYYSPITISSSSSSDESDVACKVEEKNGEVESAECRSNYALFKPTMATNEMSSTRLDASSFNSYFANFVGSSPMSGHQNAHFREENRSRVCPPMIFCVPYYPQGHRSTLDFPSYGSSNNILGVRSHSGIQKPYYGSSFSRRYGHSGWSKPHFRPKPLVNSANNDIGLSIKKTVGNANYRPSSKLLGGFNNNAVAGMMQYAKPTTIGDGNGAYFSVEGNLRMWEGGQGKKIVEAEELDLTLKL